MFSWFRLRLEFGPTILTEDSLSWIESLAGSAMVLVRCWSGNRKRLAASGVKIEFVSPIAAKS